MPGDRGPVVGLSNLGPARSPGWLAPGFTLPFCVLCLLWPAAWNTYPIVFADTGTYLSQAMHRYLGWDRPVFYSLFIYPLHLGLTTWPVILVQSCLTVLVLDVTRHALGAPRLWLAPVTLVLALATWLPWTVSELMPDLFTPLLVLLLGVLLFAPFRFRPWHRAALIVLAAFMIATQQSSVPLAFGLLLIFIPARAVLAGQRGGALLAPLLAPGLAAAAMVLVNAIGFGAVSLSPYGNVFLLARVIYDGPGMTVLRRDCPGRGWLLCPFLDRFPVGENDFLWRKDSPIVLAGGHKAVAAEADSIIHAAIAAEPARLLVATLDHTLEQLTRFASGDGLRGWAAPAGTWIDADFPSRESAAFHAARQQMGTLWVPPPLAIAHRLTALGGIAAALLLLPLAMRPRRFVLARDGHAGPPGVAERAGERVVAWFLALALVTLPVGAAITGGLSAPFDRYQSRIVWLPAAVVLLGLPTLTRRARPE